MMYFILKEEKVSFYCPNLISLRIWLRSHPGEIVYKGDKAFHWNPEERRWNLRDRNLLQVFDTAKMEEEWRQAQEKNSKAKDDFFDFLNRRK